MIKKLFAKLMGWQEQRTNFAEKRFQENEAMEKENARERQQAQQDRMRQDSESKWEEVKIPEGQEPKSPDAE